MRIRHDEQHMRKEKPTDIQTQSMNQVKNNRKQLIHQCNVTNLVKTNYVAKHFLKYHSDETASKVFRVRLISLIAPLQDIPNHFELPLIAKLSSRGNS